MWTEWLARSITTAGDTIKLVYRDRTFPAYDYEPLQLFINGDKMVGWEIPDVIDKLLTDHDLAVLFASAQRKPA